MNPHIWKRLPFVLSNGYQPAVKRQYLFVGISRGQQCRFLVELTSQIDANRYRCRAVFAHNCLFTPDAVRLDLLQPQPT